MLEFQQAPQDVFPEEMSETQQFILEEQRRHTLPDATTQRVTTADELVARISGVESAWVNRALPQPLFFERLLFMGRFLKRLAAIEERYEESATSQQLTLIARLRQTGDPRGNKYLEPVRVEQSMGRNGDIPLNYGGSTHYLAEVQYPLAPMPLRSLLEHTEYLGSINDPQDKQYLRFSALTRD